MSVPGPCNGTAPSLHFIPPQRRLRRPSSCFLATPLSDSFHHFDPTGKQALAAARKLSSGGSPQELRQGIFDAIHGFVPPPPPPGAFDLSLEPNNAVRPEQDYATAVRTLQRLDDEQGALESELARLLPRLWWAPAAAGRRARQGRGGGVCSQEVPLACRLYFFIFLSTAAPKPGCKTNFAPEIF